MSKLFSLLIHRTIRLDELTYNMSQFFVFRYLARRRGKTGLGLFEISGGTFVFKMNSSQKPATPVAFGWGLLFGFILLAKAFVLPGAFFQRTTQPQESRMPVS